jgi:hypothetical protein
LVAGDKSTPRDPNDDHGDDPEAVTADAEPAERTAAACSSYTNAPTVSLDPGTSTSTLTTPPGVDQVIDGGGQLADLRFPDPHANSLQSPMATMQIAVLMNALSLSLDLNEVVKPNCPSPFYNPTAATAPHDVALAAMLAPSPPSSSLQLASVPQYLRPTLPQIMFPHHVCFDLLPLPMLRARLILLSVSAGGADSSSTTMAEFKNDVYCGPDALVCWPGAASGQPWDPGCWEAAPWFLRKWKVFVGGEQGELWTNSLLWRQVRGEVDVVEDVSEGLPA